MSADGSGSKPPPHASAREGVARGEPGVSSSLPSPLTKYLPPPLLLQRFTPAPRIAYDYDFGEWTHVLADNPERDRLCPGCAAWFLEPGDLTRHLYAAHGWVKWRLHG